MISDCYSYKSDFLSSGVCFQCLDVDIICQVSERILIFSYSNCHKYRLKLHLYCKYQPLQGTEYMLLSGKQGKKKISEKSVKLNLVQTGVYARITDFFGSISHYRACSQANVFIQIKRNELHHKKGHIKKNQKICKVW